MKCKLILVSLLSLFALGEELHAQTTNAAPSGIVVSPPSFRPFATPPRPTQQLVLPLTATQVSAIIAAEKLKVTLPAGAVIVNGSITIRIQPSAPVSTQ